MEDWSTLPTELIHFISLRLPTSTDLLRFRSVCSAWRSAVQPPPSSSYRYPILPNSGISDTSWGFYLSRRSVYALQSPIPEKSSWIVKIERDNNNHMHLIHPLTRSEIKLLPHTFPKIFDFMNVRVKELGEEYTLQYINFKPTANSIGQAGNLYMEKVAVLNGVGVGDGFVLLTIHVSGKLVVYRSGDEKWRVINDLPSPYDDVILRGGRFYAVDTTGRMVVVDQVGLSVSVVANPVFGGDKKFLVDSDGELILVDMYLSVGPDDDSGFEPDIYEDCFMNERTVKFKVFRFDEKAGKWIEVSDLGDKMLFLGDNCMFAASALDIFGDGSYVGNHIFFTDQSCSREADGVWDNQNVGMFNMETGSIGPIDSQVGYSMMFWPPPEWVYSATSITAGVDQLRI